MRVVDQTENIKNTLHNLFDSNYDKIRNLSYKNFVSYLLDNNEVFFELNSKELIYDIDDEDIQRLKDSLKNFKLASIFEKAVRFECDETQIKQSFKKELLIIFSKLKKENLNKFNNLKRQGLFFSYGQTQQAWFTLYGKGNFPLLKEPKYFDYDYSQELFIQNQIFNLSELNQPLINLEAIIDELDLYNELLDDNEIVNSIYNAYHFKLFILINEVITENKNEIFSGLAIQKPFYIYGNQHGGELINIHILE